MRKKRINGKVKHYVTKYKDNPCGGRSVSAYGGNNLANPDAGELKSGKPAASKEVGGLWKEIETAHKAGLIKIRLVSSGAWKAFLIFSALVILDYILTVFAIRQHFSEFNPLTVSIYRNFQNPELIFFFFKAAVIGLNGLLIYLMLWLEKSIKMHKKSARFFGMPKTSLSCIFGKIALAYAALAAFFAFAVVVYDVGIITGAFALPDFANSFIFGFFKLFGMV